MDEVYSKSTTDYGMCLPPTSDAEALRALKNHFLGEDYYVTMPMSGDQCNTEIVATILDLNPKRRSFIKWLRDMLDRLDP